MKQKITQMKLVRYLFTALLALLFVNCSKERSSEEPKSNTQGEHTISSKQAEAESSSKDYELSADGLTLIKWKNTSTQNLDMNRDSQLRKITSIGEDAFRDFSNLKTVHIASSVTRIGSRAFEGCSNLTSINIPNSVRDIGKSAFWSCIYNHRTTKTNQKYPSVNL